MRKSFAIAVALMLLAGVAAAQEKVVLPAGTAVRMKLETPISTTTTKAGDAFAGRVTKAVVHLGNTIIPVGAAIEGRVVRISEPRRYQGRPTIDLRPEYVTMPDGQKFAINAVVVDTTPVMDVSEEGEIKGKGRDGDDNKELAIGAGAGTVVGAVAGGGKGALIGGLVGATATSAHWLWKRRSARLVAGTEIIMELSRPMTMQAEEAD